METLGTLSEGDWCSVGGMYHLYQEADFMANFLSLPTEPYGDSIFTVQPTLCPSRESATSLSGRAFCSFDAVYNDSHCSSNVNMDECIAVSFLPNLGSYDYFDNLITARASISTEICEAEAANGSYLIDGDDSPRREITGGEVSRWELKDTQLPWGCDDFAETAAANSKKSTSSDKSRKRCQNSEDGNVKNVKRKNKIPDLPGKIDEESRATLTLGQGSACLSEGDSSTRRELSGCLPIISSREPATLNLTGKTRATRGTATDPQSLYARKRRERINERLRILQKLVPNGTKVDISTMLEEAVRYVKFLQLQIRMLSSDELWMYAPISYNGMNIGFDWDTLKTR